MSDAARTGRTLDAAATLALAGYSLVAGLGFARVFGDWTFLRDIVAIVVVGHGISLAARSLRAPGWASFGALTLVLAWLVAWQNYPTTFAALFPTRTTWNIAWADVALVRDQFEEAVAPVAYVGGWSLLAGIGVALVVLLGDAFAFHAHGRGEALVPGGVLFVFVAAVGANRHRVSLTLALVGAGAVAVALLRLRFSRPPRTVLGHARHPLTTTIPAAAMAGAVVVLGAWAVGPRLPGAGAEAWIDTRGRGGGVTEVVSPLVDIRGRLVNRAPVELFTVAASTGSYWRVSALPNFDGNTWGLPERALEDIGGSLNAARPGAVENRQVITVSGLGGRLVPAAPDPVRADGEGLRFNDDTSTLVRTDRDLEAGDRIEVVSAMPRFSVDALRQASAVAPPDPIYLELPRGFPRTVGEQAAAVTVNAATTYDKARALQDWFRSEFDYSLEVPGGHNTSAIEAFLRQRVGYCEQFAGTFAAMARALGIPARVAVGFTPGTPAGEGTFAVLGKNAHAWPEVWFDGLGWVAFEPTPGRGAPGGEQHTGVAPDQDDAPVEEVAAPAPAETPPRAPAQPEQPDVGQFIEDLPTNEPQFRPLRHELGTRPWPLIVPFAAVGAVLAAPAVARRVRRRRFHRDVAEQVVALWQRAVRAVEDTGVRVDPTMTPIEQARSASPKLPVAARPLRELARLATAATYAPPGALEDLALDLDDPTTGPLRWTRQIEHVAGDYLTGGQRLRKYFTVWH